MKPSCSCSLPRLLLVALCIAPLLFGVLSLALGQDANWDLRNYHWYNAYAFLNGRWDIDILPSQTPSFYNPTLDVLVYGAAQVLSARGVGFLLGAVQGLNFILLFLLAQRLLPITNLQNKAWASLGVALVGMLGGGGLAQLGTTFFDNIISLGVLGSLLLVVVNYDTLLQALPRRAFSFALLAGLPVGAAMGLKQPSVIFCIGLCFALLAVPASFWRRMFLAFFFGVGILIGIAVFSGHWMWFLYEQYGNPLFPYFNDLFHSPWGLAQNYRDTQFVPQDWIQRLFLPLYFAFEPRRVGEIFFRDLRVPTMFVLMLLAAGAIILRSFRKQEKTASAPSGPVRYVLTAVALSYGMWIAMFCIYRYLIPLEMLAPLAIVLAISLLSISNRMQWKFALVALVLVQAATIPGNWERVSWGQKFVEVETPTLPDNSMVLMVGYQPTSYVVPAFPREVPFVRIQSNFTSWDQQNAFVDLMQRRVAEHNGSFHILFIPWEEWAVAPSLAAYGLNLDTESCQTVKANLGEAMRLCDVRRAQIDGASNPA